MLFGVFIVSNILVTTYLSVLTVPNYERIQIDNFEDIARHSLKVYVDEAYNNVRFFTFTSDSTVKVYREFSKLMVVFKVSQLNEEIKNEIRTGKAVMFLQEDQMNMVLGNPSYFRPEERPLYQVGREKFGQQNGFPISRTMYPELTEKMRDLIHYLHASGLVNKIYSDKIRQFSHGGGNTIELMSTTSSMKADGDRPMGWAQLSFQQFNGLFLDLLKMYFLAALLFCLEIILAKIRVMHKSYIAK